MNRINRGYDSEDDQAGATEADKRAFRMAKTGEVTIVHSGKRYIVRRTARKQIVELGRYTTLEEALHSIASVQQSANRSSKLNQEDGLWCTYCLDDPSITICAFCGCKECFGKFDPHLLILCDECDRETHAYCLHPPQTTVPSADPWYCESCAAHVSTRTASDSEVAQSTQEAPTNPEKRYGPSQLLYSQLVSVLIVLCLLSL